MAAFSSALLGFVRPAGGGRASRKGVRDVALGGKFQFESGGDKRKFIERNREHFSASELSGFGIRSPKNGRGKIFGTGGGVSGQEVAAGGTQQRNSLLGN